MTEKASSKLSREEIAKQFQLPERKSKIAYILKQDDKKYCICRSSDTSRFMIACDSCEEWYHGDCIGIQENQAKSIHKYFCVQCQDEDQTLVIQFKPGVKADVEDRVYAPKKKKRRDRQELGDITASSNHWTDDRDGRHKSSKVGKTRRKVSCGRCANCLRHQACGQCGLCQRGRGDQCLRLRCLTAQSKHDTNRKRSKSSAKLATDRVRRPSARSRRRRGGSHDTSKAAANEKEAALRQCCGLECVNPARPHSKYCSDACGLQLATNRIFQVLPARIQEWKLTNCIAEEFNKRELESVRKQQQEVKRVLQELDKRHKELDLVIERSKRTTIDLSQDLDQDQEGVETEMNMYCITCGYEIHSRTAIRHMERCFNKYESQASFGSKYKTRVEGKQLFCDVYNAQNGTYCKRLRVLCPEHAKDPKIGDQEVCGCPLVTNVFDLTGEFCRAAKKECIRHYCWEKLRRAEIDMEIVRQWLKIDELIEQERLIRQRMTDRAGVLALMLHSTYNHELMEEMAANHQPNQTGALTNSA
ncbi:CXXC-type zinc finger protein 1 [Nilaparvata lugens]|uniref:CXXC-type zinc finger protein 1 n=1 Tax=Nilaparvata lugens TaxID=108931 RepID=UPI00193D728C|nr:CXXC-type zinc finger protein 1 [Nilaparvata lugens]